MQVVPTGGEVLLEDATGGPGAVLSRHGDGWLLLVTHPVEHYLAGIPDAYGGTGVEATHLLYQRLAETIGIPAGIFPPQVEARKIPVSKGNSWLAVNHEAEEVAFSLPGTGEQIRLGAKEARLLPR